MKKDKSIDETGNRYGRLVIIEKAENQPPSKKTYWLCQCKCGKQTIVRGTHLRLGKIKSCGCLREDLGRLKGISRRLPRGIAAFRQYYARLRCRAKSRSIEWSLTKEEVYPLAQQPCYYCGAEPIQRFVNTRYNGFYVHNGLDRIDSDKGYSIDNVVPSCAACNIAKGIMATEQFFNWVARVYDHNKKRER